MYIPYFASIFFIAYTYAMVVGANGFSKGRGEKSLVFFLLCISASIWILAFCGTALAGDLATAMVWRRLSTLGWGVAYSFFLHLALLISDELSFFRKKYAYLLLYIPSALIVYVFAINSTTAEVLQVLRRSEAGWSAIPSRSLWDYFFYVYYISFSLLAAYCIVQWGRKTDNEANRKAAKFILIAFVTALFFGSITDTLLPYLLVTNLPQIAPVFMVILLASLNYAVKNSEIVADKSETKEVAPVILNQKTFLSFTMYMVFIVLISGGVLFANMLMNPAHPTYGLIWASLSIVFAVCLLLIKRLQVPHMMKENITTLLMSVYMIACPVIYHFNEVNNIAWAIPFMIMIPIVLISNRFAFWVACGSMAITGLTYSILVWQTHTVMNNGNFILKSMVVAFSVFLVYSVSKIWAEQRDKQDSLVGYQQLLSAISISLANASDADLDQKLREAEGFVGEYFKADECYFQVAGEDEKEVYKIHLIFSSNKASLSQTVLQQLEILENTISSVMEHTRYRISINRLANYDNLTGLPTRSRLMKQLEDHIVQAGRLDSKFALIHIDIDSFSEVNSIVGYSGGDLMIKETANILSAYIPQEAILSRFSGDEFFLLTPSMKSKGEVKEWIREYFDKIYGDLKIPFSLFPHEFYIDLRSGISFYPDDGQDLENLVNYASVAMCHSKNLGKNVESYYSPEMQTDSLNNLTMTCKLQNALENEELLLHYQPLTNIKTDEIVGFEALLRWNNPELGNIPPNIFIPLAEQSDLIVSIGTWVINEALRQLSKWDKTYGRRFRISINLAPRQLLSRDLVAVVKRAIEENKVDPAQVDLEITEGIIAADFERLRDVISSLSDIGVEISIDDFGMEYSSFLRLKSLPVDRLKIDMFYIREIEQDETNIIPVEVMIRLAKSFDMVALAEGVETQQQLELLKQLGCDEYQGYYKSKPLPAEQIESLLGQ